MIGRYKLRQQVGEGGFGVVFMAEQREPVMRQVALKIIKLGMDTRQVIARFEQERQALALMVVAERPLSVDAVAIDIAVEWRTGREGGLPGVEVGQVLYEWIDVVEAY